MTISEFENKWVQKIKDGLLKTFPDDFINTENFELLNMPGKPLLKGSELFGNYEIIDTNGIPFLSTDSLSKMKYILYANRNGPVNLKVLTNEEDRLIIVKKYEKHLDEILKRIIQDFNNEFPTSNKFISVSSKIYQLLNLYRY